MDHVELLLIFSVIQKVLYEQGDNIPVSLDYDPEHQSLTLKIAGRSTATVGLIGNQVKVDNGMSAKYNGTKLADLFIGLQSQADQGVRSCRIPSQFNPFPGE